MRYYWEDDQIVVKMLNYDNEFTYEYLGEFSRLILTPLSDRCMITVCSALNLYQGAAPQGPAGCGKTETTKELARCFGRQCVVFGCSDSMNHVGLRLVLIGICLSGAWGCFDEFNRIRIEVLSSAATYVQAILNAMERRADKLVIDGENLPPPNRNCGICVTMNPGYAGRTEMPDNMK